jgi:hypothetical protein
MRGQEAQRQTTTSIASLAISYSGKDSVVTSFKFLDEQCEIAVVAAAIGRINNADLVDLLERLLNHMDAQELAHYKECYTFLEFGTSGRPSPL